MDHDAAREQLELAALEPGGLERLMAGDTATSQAVAAHLAGCPSCTEESVRLQRAVPLIRTVVRELPAPDLRARTMAAIRAEGVIRPFTAAAGAAAAEGATLGAAGLARPAGPTSPAAPIPASTNPAIGSLSGAGPSSDTALPLRRRWRGAPVLGLAATIAAAVVLSVVSTSLIVGGRVDGQLAGQAEQISALEEVTTATLNVTAQPDAEHVALASASDGSLTGSLAFSPSVARLVVVTTGLTPPPAGMEYRCWIQVGGPRQAVGKMFFSQDLAYWVGSAPAVSGVSKGATFGISLVGIGGGSLDTPPVLVGAL
jgi:hypothetical protein